MLADLRRAGTFELLPMILQDLRPVVGRFVCNYTTNLGIIAADPFPAACSFFVVLNVEELAIEALLIDVVFN